MQVNSINTYNCSGCGRKPQVAFGFADPKGGLGKASAGISGGGQVRENDIKDAFNRLDAQKPVKKRGIKNFIKRIFKKQKQQKEWNKYASKLY